MSPVTLPPTLYPPRAELHLHLYGCVQAEDLLRHLAASDPHLWDWYEEGMQAAYGFLPPTRKLVERFRHGDSSVIQEFSDLFVFGDADAGSFARFSAKGRLLWINSELEDSEELSRRLEAEAVSFLPGIRARFTQQDIAYAEFRTNLYPALLEAMATDTSPLIQRMAPSLSREDPWPEWETVQELALGPYGYALTAIDFCNVEEGFPPKDKADFFKEVQAFNRQHPERALAILYHAGESFTDKSLESAIRWVQEAAELGAHRLGHAIALGIAPEAIGEHRRQESVGERKDQIAYDLKHQAGLRALGIPVDSAALQAELDRLTSLPETSTVSVEYSQETLAEVRRRQDYAMQAVKQTGAVIEVCPTSNRRIAGISNPLHHPIHRFLAAGLPVVISTDDPGSFDVTLDDELEWVRETVGAGADLRQQLLQTAWLSRSEVLAGRETGLLSSAFHPYNGYR